MIKGKTAIIAGGGDLPLAVAHRLHERGNAPYLILLKDNAAQTLYKYPHTEISIVEFSKLLNALKKNNIKNIILAGWVVNRPTLHDLHFDWATLKILPRLFLALGRGDDALLRCFIQIMERYHYQVVGAHEITPELLAPEKSLLTQIPVTETERKNIRLAMKAAIELGKQDLGQGAVVIDGEIVALEDAKGTDFLLKRVAKLRNIKNTSVKSGVLVKMKKPNQESRADLPTIGPKTIEYAYKAGLAGLAIEAGSSFILNREETIKKANEYGLFIETL